MTEVPVGRRSRSITLWIALALIAVGVYLFAEGRLLRGPMVAVAGILVGLAGRPSRKSLIFGVVTVTLASLLPVVLVVGLDLYLHHRYAATGGYNIWGYRGPVLHNKRSGERRIAVLGGSTAFGYGVKSDESYPSHLERTLNDLERTAGRAPVTVANLGWNGEGAFSFRFTLADYDYLNPDVVLLYSGYNDLSPNQMVFRRESAIFRRTGYLPILPVVSAGWLRRRDLIPVSADDKVVFQPNLADRSASQAADLARGITQALEREVRRLSLADSAPPPTATSGGDCGRWDDYCHWLSEAVRFALDHGRHVVVVTEPYLAGGGDAANGQFDQQNAVRGMLSRRFPGESRVHYLNMGRAVDLNDTVLCYDGMHLTPPGNVRLANRLALGVQAILAEVARGDSAASAPRVDAGASPPTLTDRVPPAALALGRYEAARDEARKSLVEKPGDKRSSDALALAELRLGRMLEARKTLEEQLANHVDDVWTHERLYLIAGSTADRAFLDREIAWAETHPDRFVMLSARADVAAASGRLMVARDLRRRAIDDASRRGRIDAAAVIIARQAIAELLVGDTRRAVDNARTAIAMSRTQGTLWAGALVDALAGNPDGAASLAEAFKMASPPDVVVEKLWMTVLRGSIHLGRGDPQGAIDLLESTVTYERGTYWPRYLRGLAHLKMGHGFQASLEFSRILEQPVVGSTDIVYVLAERQFARASSINGGGLNLGETYLKFFRSWQYADPDLALVGEFREEYVDLRRSIGLPLLPDGVWRQTP